LDEDETMSCWCALVAVVDLLLLLLLPLRLFDGVCVYCTSAAATVACTLLPEHRNTLRNEKFLCAATTGEMETSYEQSASMFAPTRKVHPWCSPERIHTELLFRSATSPLPSKIAAAGGDIRVFSR
jgi:hypothetical protein